MKMGIATLSLLAVLCLTLSAPAFAGTIFTTGPITGTKGLFVTGPNLPNVQGTIQDISDGFVGVPGTVTGIEWGEWSLSPPTSASYSLGTSAFGDDLASVTVNCPSAGCNIVPTNFHPFGYNVYDVTVGFPNVVLMASTMYWLTISNATDAAADGSQAWDDNGTALALCNYRQSGINLLACGPGTTKPPPPQPQAGEGEAFTIIGSQATTPEPSSIMLFGSGLLGVAGVLRRKLKT